ncbi:MAG TPA: site-2 protease family protein [Firmicutes bacterium]|nr:site-2 protease family protein [Bacillota bacterium]
MWLARDMIFRIPALLLALTVHEYAHAKVADALGDPTPRAYGRLTLNPLAHLDPLGLLMLWLVRFGWAKPVPINPNYLRPRRVGLILVSLAGAGANVVTAFLLLLLLKLQVLSFNEGVASIVELAMWYNIFLAVFNLIPIPPLDGSKVVAELLPRRTAYELARLEPYGPVILIVVLYLGLTGIILLPLASWLYQVLYRVTDLLVFGFLYRFLLHF